MHHLVSHLFMCAVQAEVHAWYSQAPGTQVSDFPVTKYSGGLQQPLTCDPHLCVLVRCQAVCQECVDEVDVAEECANVLLQLRI